MNGAEHYAEAERLLNDPGWQDPDQIATAQVHATLALAAATADPLLREPNPYEIQVGVDHAVARDPAHVLQYERERWDRKVAWDAVLT